MEHEEQMTIEAEGPAGPREEDAVAPAEGGARDFLAEAEQVRALYPEFQEVPEEVALEAAGGASLLQAYVHYRQRNAERESQALRQENAVLRQNAEASARAPLQGVTGGGAAGDRPQGDFLRGFFDDGADRW